MLDQDEHIIWLVISSITSFKSGESKAGRTDMDISMHCVVPRREKKGKFRERNIGWKHPIRENKSIYRISHSDKLKLSFSSSFHFSMFSILRS